MSHRSRLMLLAVLLGLTAGPSPGDAPKEADPRDGFRQLGKLWAGLAERAREKERSPVKASFFYLKAAQAFERAGDKQGKNSLVEGLAAAQPLRAFWVHPGWVIAMTFLPGDRQVLTCGHDGRVHVWDVATGREVRSFRAIDIEKAGKAEGRGYVQGAGKVEGVSFSPDRSRLLLWEGRNLQLWDVARGRLLRKWNRPARRGSMGIRFPDPAGAVFLDGGKRLLVWGTGKPAEVWDAGGKARLSLIDKGSIGDSPYERRPLPWSRDGTRLVTADESAVYLWDLTSGKLLRKFKSWVQEDWPLRARLSPDGKRVLVMGTKDGAARVFDAPTGKRLATFSHERRRGDDSEASPDGAVFSPDGTRLLTWNYHHEARLWDVERGRILHTFRTEKLLSAQFHSAGTQVLTTGDRVVLWDAKTGNALARYGAGATATFTRDGSRLLILAEWGSRAELWDVQGEKRTRVFNTPGTNDALLSEDETLLLVNVSDAYGLAGAQLWDLAQPEGRGVLSEDEALPRARVYKHDKPVRTAALSRDEAHLLTCDEGGRAHLWDAARGRRVRSFAHGDGILGAGFSPDESRVLTWGEKGAVKLWETRTGKELRTFDHPADVRGAEFSPDGSHLLTRDADYTAWWWDVSRRKPVHKFEHPRDVFGARLSPKATRALTWGLDGKARLWDLAGGRAVRSLAHGGAVFGATFAGEGRAWTWSADGLREWDLTTGKVLRRQRPPDGVASAELSPDGKRFLVRTAMGWVQVWDVGAGKGLATIRDPYDIWYSGLSERLSPGVLSRDQTRILTWARGSAHLWELASEVRLKWFRHPGTLRGAAFTRDESRVLTWGDDGTARLWESSVPRPLSPDDQLLELEVRSGLTVDEGGKLRTLKREEWQHRKDWLEGVLKKDGRP